jgi:hypothetical protein
MSTYQDRETNPDKVAELAADICELVWGRKVLIAEGILATYLALTHQMTNCGCSGCTCGDKAHERASKEMRSTVGAAAIKLFQFELDAREEAAAE